MRYISVSHKQKNEKNVISHFEVSDTIKSSSYLESKLSLIFIHSLCLCKMKFWESTKLEARNREIPKQQRFPGIIKTFSEDLYLLVAVSDAGMHICKLRAAKVIQSNFAQF